MPYHRTIFRHAFCALGLIGLICAASPSNAQAPHGPDYATVSYTAKPAVIKRGGRGVLTIKIVVKPGFHINAAKPNDPNLIATMFIPKAVKGITLLLAHYPAPHSVMSAGERISAYTGTVTVAVPFMVASSAHPGKAYLSGTLTYQGCNAVACFPPKQEKITAPITVH